MGQRLTATNQILKGLNDTAPMVKKEPSNNHANWAVFEHLYNDVYEQRVFRAKEIISILKIVIPIAGNINEHRPVSAVDWAEAEENITVPAISSEDLSIPPFFEAILNITSGVIYPNLKGLQSELFSRLVLPTVKQSQEQHRAWFSRFLAKHRPTLDMSLLPPIPITPQVWQKLLYDGHILPSSVINEYNQYALLRLRMPRDIQDFNETLRQDKTLRNDPNVNHWLSIFGEHEERPTFRVFMKSLLLTLIFPSDEKATSMVDLLDVLVSQATVLLDEYESRMDDWHELVANLKPRRTGNVPEYDSGRNEKTWMSWRNGSRALSTRLISLLKGKIASSEEGTVLPSTLPLRLWCLPYPEPRSIELEDEANLHLATHLNCTLSFLLITQEVDPLLWVSLAEDVYNTLIAVYAREASTTARLRIEIHMGDLNANSNQLAPAVQLIKVAVALKFVDSISKSDIPQKPKELTLEQALLRDLIKRLHAIMDAWLKGGSKGSGASTGVRNMAMQWKSKNKALWENICSWDST